MRVVSVRVLSLHPLRLDDIWADIRRVVAAIGRRAAGERLLAGLLARLDRVEREAAAGGEPLGVAPGERAPTLDLAALGRLEPEVVVIKPCGYPVERTLAELELSPRVLPWTDWPAVQAGRV